MYEIPYIYLSRDHGDVSHPLTTPRRKRTKPARPVAEIFTEKRTFSICARSCSYGLLHITKSTDKGIKDYLPRLWLSPLLLRSLQVFWEEAETHSVANVGKMPIRLIRVEIK